MTAAFGAAVFCVLNMIVETAFIGPLEFDISYQDEFGDFCFEAPFRKKVWPYDSVSYKVSVRSVGKCGAAESNRKLLVAETGEFDEFLNGNDILRCYYGNFNGERLCYARVRLHSQNITVMIDNRLVWPKGKVKAVWQFIMLEKLLARERAIILHSSSVVSGGRAILFSAPSGTGKSTQADLWRKYDPEAAVLNGDRNLLIKNDNVWYVCGLPWHGSSNDCLNDLVPVAGMMLIEQGRENAISEISPSGKFMRIYSETTQNGWDRTCAKRVINAVSGLIADVPVCKFSCTKDESAVLCLKGWLNKKYGSI